MNNMEENLELSLKEIGIKHKTDKAINHDFLPFYELHIYKYRNDKIKLLEIGVGSPAHAMGVAANHSGKYAKEYGGSSLRAWEEYFPNAEIFGIDIDVACLDYSYETDRVKTIIGSQADRTFLDSLDGEFDIIIDDGSHIIQHQIISLGCLFAKLKSGGVYILEDLHTSFMKPYGGNELNDKTTLSALYDLKTKNTIENKYLLPEEKAYLESNVAEIFIHGFYDGINDKNHITSVITKR